MERRNAWKGWTERMDGCMKGWMKGWVNGWSIECMAGYMDIWHDENYCDSSVSRKVKNFSFFFWKIMNSHDSLYFFMWVEKKINAKSQKFKRLELFSSLKKLFFFSTYFQIFHWEDKDYVFQNCVIYIQQCIFQYKEYKNTKKFEIFKVFFQFFC